MLWVELEAVEVFLRTRARQREIDRLRSDVAEQSGDISRSIAGPIIRENYGHSERQMDRHPMPRTLAGAIGPTDWNEALHAIVNGSPEQSVEGMKVVCHDLAQATSGPKGSAMDDIVKDADHLVSCLADKARTDPIAKTFDFSLTGSPWCQGEYPRSLITELLVWLFDERVPRMDDGSQLRQALNVLMLKILDNAKRTLSFVVLIKLLHPLDPSRAGDDDKPLRRVKTVLHELVTLRGTAINGHLYMVPMDMEPQPIILAYIDLYLQQELAAIFKKIGDKQTCIIGLYELYRITQLYPKVDIFSQLQNASVAFRTYIRDGLAKVCINMLNSTILH
ncbi:unnamed protein product [Ilex paraguariensis]|uniref:Uncharacterized protein n=1 Tax=Ilex paraguariensis TaxID=185542 RepID=A0ABC8UV85_9AQUA